MRVYKIFFFLFLQNDVVYIYATQIDGNTMYEIETNSDWILEIKMVTLCNMTTTLEKTIQNPTASPQVSIQKARADPAEFHFH